MQDIIFTYIPSLTIVYTGLIYDGKENPEHLFRAISEMVDDSQIKPTDVSVDLYGGCSVSVEEAAQKYRLQGIIFQHGIVSHKEAIEAQRRTQVLWLMKWEDKNHDAEWHRTSAPLTGKFFEYMAARRPILVTGGYPDSIDKILEETKIGDWAPRAQDVKVMLKRYLTELKVPEGVNG